MGLFLSTGTCIWGLRISVVNRNRPTDLESEPMVTRGLGSGRGTGRESGSDMYTLLYLKCVMELPWWSSDWEFALQCGGHGFDLCSGTGTPHSGEQVSPCPTTLESVCHNYGGCGPQLQSLCATTIESMRHNKRSHMTQGGFCVLPLRPETAK